jgi:murein DD-endopeptidase MepM/ murein hydrolase activator NlpD
MIGFARVAGVCTFAVVLWVVGASRVPNQEKLALNAVVPGAVMTQPFGCSSLLLEPFEPSCPSRHTHTGIDLAARQGTAVHAAAGGSAAVGFDPRGAGLYVAVTVDSHVRVIYCHLSAALVGEGVSVATGEVIGEVGSTGLATGAHLHFEVQLDGRAVDPAVWLAS